MSGADDRSLIVPRWGGNGRTIRGHVVPTVVRARYRNRGIIARGTPDGSSAEARFRVSSGMRASGAIPIRHLAVGRAVDALFTDVK